MQEASRQWVLRGSAQEASLAHRIITLARLHTRKTGPPGHSHSSRVDLRHRHRHSQRIEYCTVLLSASGWQPQGYSDTHGITATRRGFQRASLPVGDQVKPHDEECDSLEEQEVEVHPVHRQQAPPSRHQQQESQRQLVTVHPAQTISQHDSKDNPPSVPLPWLPVRPKLQACTEKQARLSARHQSLSECGPSKVELLPVWRFEMSEGGGGGNSLPGSSLLLLRLRGLGAGGHRGVAGGETRDGTLGRLHDSALANV